MSELRLYDVTVGSHKTRMRLNAADANGFGEAAVPAADTRPAAPVPTAPAPDPKSRLVTSNKMRGTDDKPTTHQHPTNERAEHHHG